MFVCPCVADEPLSAKTEQKMSRIIRVKKKNDAAINLSGGLCCLSASCR